MDETAEPRAAVVLDDLRAVEHQRPALAPQPRQQVIDAIARREVGGRGQSLGVGVQLAQAQIGVFATVKTPQKDAVSPGAELAEPVLHDRSFSLPAWPDERDHARFLTLQRQI